MLMIAVPEADSVAVPRVLPPRVKVTVPAGRPAAGATGFTVAMSRVLPMMVSFVVVSAFATTMLSVPLAAAIRSVPE